MSELKNYIKESIDSILEGKFESAAEYRRKVAVRNSHGPLMKASAWIKPQNIHGLSSNLSAEGDKEHFLYVGHLQHPYEQEKKTHIAIFASSTKPEDPEGEVRSGWDRKTVGYNVPHQWYEDTGLGHKFPSSHLVITGHYHKKADGSVEKSGEFDENRKRALMVYK